MTTKTKLTKVLATVAAVGSGVACSGSTKDSGTVTGYQVVAKSGSSLQAVPGDAISLQVEETLSDGTTAPLSSGAQVAWSGLSTVDALAAGSSDDNLPDPGATPVVVFVSNPTRTDITSAIDGVAFVISAGTGSTNTATVTATVSGVTPGGTATGTVTVGTALTGDATRGSPLYSANCAVCHAATGDGSTALPDGGFSIENMPYDFPAPGLNAVSGNPGSDPGWNGALFAIAARSDVDNNAVVLRAPMPNWLTTPSSATGKPLSTQDLADIYAYLQTQSQ